MDAIHCGRPSPYCFKWRGQKSDRTLLEITAAGAGLTRVSVRAHNAFAAVQHVRHANDYHTMNAFNGLAMGRGADFPAWTW